MKAKQPTPKPGYEFTGWATFNWGICYQEVYRTKKEAIASLICNYPNATTWDEIKDSYKIVRVKCIVL